MTRVCAVHQPNYLPRLSTLSKLLSADVWVVLDDVQFARRDYQHRARLASMDDPTTWRWLSLSTHLPDGRSTAIQDVRLHDRERCARRARGLLQQHFARGPRWHQISEQLSGLADQIAAAEYLHEITTRSTELLLGLCGWQGTVVRSSSLTARSGRSERLADLTRAVHADTYLCGTGGARYLNTAPFTSHGIQVDYFHQPTCIPSETWQAASNLSVVWTLAKHGPEVLAGLRTTRC